MSPSDHEPVHRSPVIRTLSDYETWAQNHLPHPPGSLELRRLARVAFTENSQQLFHYLRGQDTEHIISSAAETFWAATIAAANADIRLSESMSITYPDAFPRSEPIEAFIVDPTSREMFGSVRIDRALPMLEQNHDVMIKAELDETIIARRIDYDLHTSNPHDRWIRIKRGLALHGFANAALITSAVIQRFGHGHFEDALTYIVKRP